jgi:hypothetical protein
MVVFIVGVAGLLRNLWKIVHDVHFQQKLHEDYTNVIFSPCCLLDGCTILQKERLEEHFSRSLSVCARLRMRCF